MTNDAKIILIFFVFDELLKPYPAETRWNAGSQSVSSTIVDCPLHLDCCSFYRRELMISRMLEMVTNPYTCVLCRFDDGDVLQRLV